jgi:kynureninase
MNADKLEQLDAADPLGHLQEAFDIPADTIYLNGNSLGPLSRASRERINEVVNGQWRSDLITSWNKHQWIDLPLITGNKIAPLLGARAGQVVCCDSVSVNLFKLLSSALMLRPECEIILTLQDNFPTDLYIAEGLSRFLGDARLRVRSVDLEDLELALSSTPAVVMLTQVNFRDGSALDIEAITRKAQSNGSLVIWDLSHSVGVMPLELDRWNVDFAVGCGYKYLNGGPGAPAFLYVAERHLPHSEHALQGWMGHKAPFEFRPEYAASEGVERFLSGTPPIISLAALDAALELFSGISSDLLRKKSTALATTFLTLKAQYTELDELQLVSPAEAELRGAQLCFSHDKAYWICQALLERRFFADFRNPDILRLGFSPLFLSFGGLQEAVQRLAQVMREKSYENHKFAKKSKVT